MPRLHMLLVTALTLGTAMVYAACGVATGTAYCTDGNSNYPTCTSPSPHSNSCDGNPTYSCSKQVQTCKNPDLVPNAVDHTCDAATTHQSYNEFSSTQTLCGM